MGLAMREGFSLKHVGLGYYQAWVFLVVMCLSVFDSRVVAPVGEAWIRMLFSGLAALLMFLSMFVEHYLDVLGNGRWILCLSGCSGSIGTLLTIQSLSLYSSVTLFVFGLILISAGNSILLLSWIDYLSHADPKEQARHIVVAWPFAAVVTFLLLAVQLEIRQVVCCFLPVLSALTLVRCSGTRLGGEVLAQRDCLGEGHTWKGSLSRLLIAVLGVSFAFGIVRTFKSAALSMNAGGSWLFLVIAACLIAILTTAWVLSKRTPLIVTFYRCCIPVLILAYLLLPFARDVLFDLDLALLMSACFLFEMLVWLACPLIVVKATSNGVYLFGWGAAAFNVGSFFGFATSVAFDIPGMGDDALLITCVSVAGMLILVMSYVFREQGLNRLYASPRVEEPKETNRISETCSELRNEFGLSEREQEVLELLAQGRSIPYIVKLLGVSTSTAKTHARHIYQKLGIHTKQELLDLFEDR